MIEDLPGDETRAPQTQFTLDLRIAFLEALAVSGSVRSAARRVKVSHQSVYRARRSSAAFGRAWDAAMVIARGQAEALLADYAIAGVEEEVWYHGEVVGTRRRVSDRLLLAHLGRLDRMRTDTRIEALAEDFDGLLDRMRAGEPIDAPVEGEKEKKEEKEAPEISSPGQCNMRSMSPSAAAPADPPEAPPAAPADPFEGIRFTQPVRRRSKCCGGDMRWPECYNCPDYLVLQWIRGDMAEVRPYGAPPLAALGDPAKVEECQIAAFQAGEGEWWLIGEDFQAWESDGAGGWRPAP